MKKLNKRIAELEERLKDNDITEEQKKIIREEIETSKIDAMDGVENTQAQEFQGLKTQSKPEYQTEQLDTEMLSEASGSSVSANQASQGDSNDDDILVAFANTSISSEDDSIPEAWICQGSRVRWIVRYGPQKMATYKIQKGDLQGTVGLQQVSDEASRICRVFWRNEYGQKKRRYGRANIVGIVGVVFEERKGNRDYKKAPIAYLKIK